MKVKEIMGVLEAKALCLEEMTDKVEVKTACGSDMMSDVLAYVKDEGLLITGLLNAQVVRTAEMMDLPCVCFCRGKVPDDSVIELAREKGIILISTHFRLYQACGRLYKHGLDN